MGDYFGDDYFGSTYFPSGYFGPLADVVVPPGGGGVAPGGRGKWPQLDDVDDDEDALIALVLLES